MRVKVLDDQTDVTEYDLGHLQQKLKEASGALEEAVQEEMRARSKATAARNNLNDIQKRIDGVISGLKLKAPCDSDWGSVRRGA